jgi:hypothetical protein
MDKTFIGEFPDDQQFKLDMFEVPKMVTMVNVEYLDEKTLSEKNFDIIPVNTEFDGKGDLVYADIDKKANWHERFMTKGESIGLIKRHRQKDKYDIVAKGGPPLTEEEAKKVVTKWLKNGMGKKDIFAWSQSIEYKNLVGLTMRNLLRLSYEFAVRLELKIPIEHDTMSFKKKGGMYPFMARPYKVEMLSHLDYRKVDSVAKVFSYKNFDPYEKKNKFIHEPYLNSNFHIFKDEKQKIYHCIIFQPTVEDFVGLDFVQDHETTGDIENIKIESQFDCVPIIGMGYQGTKFVKNFLE